MALSIVKGLLEQYVQSLFNEGIINEQFSRIQHLKMVGRTEHFVQLINSYCLDVESILAQLASSFDLPEVDFSKLAALAAEVTERSSRFLLALDWTKTEFTQTQNKLQVLVQMERRIMRLEAKQKN
ncbi:histidine-containing phosphotransfer protein 2-like isoform X2 [Gossypium arboreum]|uniref:histidine-containing phosphotransfer protein 2-like isoform X2 n=1 Tax=Gossypium arboreum TaxID=29729 RepID=UPI0022F1B3D1|nr:histidine-containing phosphotransfer protein 2-like isoform X2 [Gossypium arboreum]